MRAEGHRLFYVRHEDSQAAREGGYDQVVYSATFTIFGALAAGSLHTLVKKATGRMSWPFFLSREESSLFPEGWFLGSAADNVENVMISLRKEEGQRQPGIIGIILMQRYQKLLPFPGRKRVRGRGEFNANEGT